MKAFIVHNGKVLILRESPKNPNGTNPDKYDVPGGRLNPGEHFLDCLRREVMEETGLAVEVGRTFFANEWRPAVRGEQWQIVGIFFECSASAERIVLNREHDDFKWINPREYKNADLIENLHPAFEAYNAR